ESHAALHPRGRGRHAPRSHAGSVRFGPSSPRVRLRVAPMHCVSAEPRGGKAERTRRGSPDVDRLKKSCERQKLEEATARRLPFPGPWQSESETRRDASASVGIRTQMREEIRHHCYSAPAAMTKHALALLLGVVLATTPLGGCAYGGSGSPKP